MQQQQQRQQPQVVEHDMGEKVIQEDKPKSLAPLQSAPPVAPTQPKGDIVIRTGYDPKTTKKAKVVQGDIEYLISPLTGNTFLLLLFFGNFFCSKIIKLDFPF